MEHQLSKLHFYSIGVAAENLPLDEVDLEITPTEVTMLVDGELNTDAEQIIAKGVDADKKNYSSQVNAAVTIKATWIPLGCSNRMTPPNVRRGARVVIYRFGDVDRYYWTTEDNDLRHRKLETVVYAFSATRDEDVTPDSTNSYIFEISTHKKFIRLLTSKADKEPFVYEIKLDTKVGQFTLTDDKGNTLFLDSKTRTMKYSNIDGSVLDITAGDMIANMTNSISMKAPNISVTGDTVNIKGETGDCKIQQISLVKHKHPETQSITEPPIPG